MTVKNEDRFIWYAIASILPYVHKILITDTGSTDNTIDIINGFRDKRIILLQKHIRSREEIALVRQEQIEATSTDWIWIVDGDEIYTNRLCREISEIIKKRNDSVAGIVAGRHDLLGDIYHFQDNSAGFYRLFGRKGHFALRLINRKKVEGLHIEGVYPYEGYYDRNGIELINFDKKLFLFTRGSLFHAMYLKRSSLGANLGSTFHRTKFKTEKGIGVRPPDRLPEVFFQNHPENVEDVTGKRGNKYEIKAAFISPVKNIKRSVRKG